MQDKNRKLAKENNQLKSLISQKTQLQEEILKKSIKSEYSQILTYKQMMESIECGIGALEDALQRCKEVKDSILRNKRMLSDTTNVNRKEIKANVTGIDEIIKDKNETKKVNGIGESLFDKWN